MYFKNIIFISFLLFQNTLGMQPNANDEQQINHQTIWHLLREARNTNNQTQMNKCIEYLNNLPEYSITPIDILRINGTHRSLTNLYKAKDSKLIAGLLSEAQPQTIRTIRQLLEATREQRAIPRQWIVRSYVIAKQVLKIIVLAGTCLHEYHTGTCPNFDNISLKDISYFALIRFIVFGFIMTEDQR